MNYSVLVNLFHILIVAPLLWAIGTNKLPEEYKNLLIWVALAVALYHLWCLVKGVRLEGMEELNGANIHHIRMFDSYPGYDKPDITVNTGDVVVWTNIGEVEHTVTANNGEFNSGYLKPSENYSVKFENKGTFMYHCMVHGGWMRGVVTVV